MKRLKLEFWADSFHEGTWACQGISKFFKLESVSYEKNFIPIYIFQLSNDTVLEIKVLGSYKNWSPLPSVIGDLISWGKPDLIAYDPEKEKIIFAVEETAAVPTGNQALQRCERIYGSLRMKIPFWYLIGEFGVHLDGGIRRDSIWPSILAIKLSCIQKTPCVVLHYSDHSHPEDYSVGEGVNSLFKSLSNQINMHFGFASKESNQPILEEQYLHMLNFINSQWKNVISYMPHQELLEDTGIAREISKVVCDNIDPSKKLTELLSWGTTANLPSNIVNKITPGGFLKRDKFVDQLEILINNKNGYNLSSNAGSRPQKIDDVKDWIRQQERMFNSYPIKDVNFSINIEDFPKSKTGLHVTTAKNIVYLIDDKQSFEDKLKLAFPRIKDLNCSDSLPILLYISNSMKPGRIFGDPYTGQLTAFVNIFARNTANDQIRTTFAYYPHQAHSQLFKSKGVFNSNKGITIMRELLDFAIFHGGVVVNLKTGEII